MESSRRERVRHEIRYDEFDSLEYRVERVEVLGYFATREEAERAIRFSARCDCGDERCDVSPIGLPMTDLPSTPTHRERA